MKQQDRPSLLRRAAEIVVFYAMIVVLCAVLKIASPWFQTTTWTAVGLYLPAGATAVALLHRLLVRWILSARS